MTARTSDSHPLYVDWLEEEFPGRLGMTIAPGTKDQSGRGPRWDRDVAKDIGGLVEARLPAQVLVSLLEEHELERYAGPQSHAPKNITCAIFLAKCGGR